MKRHIALQTVSREHQHSLSIAHKIIRAVQANDIDLMGKLEKEVQIFYETELKAHFQQEEETFFNVLFDKYPMHIELANTYIEEHKALRNLIMQIKEGSTGTQLEEFAVLLKSHTRREERELFPMIERSFTEKQLQMIQEESLQ